jgi:hypothetical protein
MSLCSAVSGTEAERSSRNFAPPCHGAASDFGLDCALGAVKVSVLHFLAV